MKFGAAPSVKAVKEGLGRDTDGVIDGRTRALHQQRPQQTKAKTKQKLSNGAPARRSKLRTTLTEIGTVVVQAENFVALL